MPTSLTPSYCPWYFSKPADVRRNKQLVQYKQIHHVQQQLRRDSICTERDTNQLTHRVSHSTTWSDWSKHFCIRIRCCICVHALGTMHYLFRLSQNQQTRELISAQETSCINTTTKTWATCCDSYLFYFLNVYHVHTNRMATVLQTLQTNGTTHN